MPLIGTRAARFTTREFPPERREGAMGGVSSVPAGPRNIAGTDVRLAGGKRRRLSSFRRYRR